MKSWSSKKFSVHSWPLHIMAPDPRGPWGHNFKMPSRSSGILAISLPWLSPRFPQDNPRCGEPLPLLPLCLAFCLSQLHSPVLQEAALPPVLQEAFPHHSGPCCTTISAAELLISPTTWSAKVTLCFYSPFPMYFRERLWPMQSANLVGNTFLHGYTKVGIR